MTVRGHGMDVFCVFVEYAERVKGILSVYMKVGGVMGKSLEKIPLERVDPYRWRIPQRYNAEMRVPGMVYADDELIEQILEDNALQQVANVATLPGVVGYSLAMPDFHWGYGFPVGGVAATHADYGVVSPGGIGFDINCGVRLLATDLLHEQIRSKVDKLADELFNNLLD